MTTKTEGLRIPALVMAGGRGSRLGLPVEKPLLQLLGKPLVTWVVKAVQSALRISEFYVVTSPNTYETEKLCRKMGLQVVRTAAKGYHDDLKEALSQAGINSAVMTVSSDIPALTGRFLDDVIATYESCDAEALTVLVPVKRRLQLGLSVSSTYPFEGASYCVGGVNVIDAMKISSEKLTEKAYITEDLEAALNVNTMADLAVAEKLMRQRRASE